MGEQEHADTVQFGRTVEQAILAIKKGAHLLKCGRRGKPKFCPFRLSMDEKYLIWYAGEEERQLRLSSVVKIVRGQRTSNFQRQIQPDRGEQSFSLVYASGERTLDLICKDKAQADSWFTGLRAVISKHQHSRTSGNFRSCRGVQSCINSPAGFIRRKQNLGILAEATDFSQMSSLCGSPSQSLQERCLSNGFSCSSDSFYSSESSFSRTYDVVPASPYHETEYNLTNRKPSLVDSEIHKHSSQRFLAAPALISLQTPKQEILKDTMIWGAIGGFIDGSNNQTDALFPKLLESTKMFDVQSISVGGKHAALVTKQGEMFCWGDGHGGKLGLKVHMDVNHPKLVESLYGVSVQSVSCSEYQTCAVSESGELYMWGGDGNNMEGARCRFLPCKVSESLNGTSVLKVACGEWHTAIITSSGQLFTYGDGTFGVLGHGNLEDVSKPKEVESLKGLKVKSVSCGPWHTAAIVETATADRCYKYNANDSGKLFTWGDGDKGQLGHSDGDRRLVPTCVLQLIDQDFVQVSCGWTLTVALTSYGTVYTMGSAVHGQLGSPRAKDKRVNIVEGNLKGQIVKEISTGSYHVAVLISVGNVYTWGKGGNGQLGLGDTRDRNFPAFVESLQGRLVERIACGSNLTAAICLHKEMSLSDQSACSSCKLPFGFTRKKHNCYNCGLLFCHACSNKKAVNASLAPNKSKLSRVCDPCFHHLHKILDSFRSSKIESCSPRLLLTPRRIADDLNSNPEIHMNENVGVENMRDSQKLRETALSPSGQPQWGQVSSPFLFRFCKDDFRSFSSTRISSIPNIRPLSLLKVSHGPNVENNLSESKEMLTEEVERLRAEVRNLEKRCELGTQKIQECQRQMEETWLLAKEEAAKCKAAKDVIKALALRLHTMKDRASNGKEATKDGSACNPSQVSPVCDDGATLPYLTPISTRSQGDDGLSSPSPIVFSSKFKSVVGKNVNHENNRLLLDAVPIKRTEPQQDGNEGSTKSEWVEQYEPGVYITFMNLPDGRKGLKRVRFSRKRFTEKEAQRWWDENQAVVHNNYGTEGYTNFDQTH